MKEDATNKQGHLRYDRGSQDDRNQEKSPIYREIWRGEAPHEIPEISGQKCFWTGGPPTPFGRFRGTQADASPLKGPPRRLAFVIDNCDAALRCVVVL